jgi:hypothetical protein
MTFVDKDKICVEKASFLPRPLPPNFGENPPSVSIERGLVPRITNPVKIQNNRVKTR